MKKILITGSEGFIGKKLINLLIKKKNIKFMELIKLTEVKIITFINVI